MGLNTYPKIYTRNMNAMANVVAGGTAYLDLPLGVRYKGLHILYSGTTFTPALMDNIRIFANQQIIHNLTGTRRDTLNQFDGMPAAATYKDLYIPFHRIGMATKQQEFMTYLNTDQKCAQCPDGIKSLRIEIDIDSSASAPAIALSAELCEKDADQAEAILRAETWTENVAVTGDYLHVHKYTGDKRRPLITRHAFWDTPAHIPSFYYLKEQTMLQQRTTVQNEHIQTSDNCVTKVAQTTCVIFDTAEQGDHRNALNVEDLSDFEVHTIHTVTNSALPVTVETLGTL